MADDTKKTEGAQERLITDDELNKIEARAEAAPAGPYTQNERTPWELSTNGGKAFCVTGQELWWLQDESRIDGLVKFIAHARQDVPALVAEVRRLRRTLEVIATAPDDVQITVETAHVIADTAREALEGE